MIQFPQTPSVSADAPAELGVVVEIIGEVARVRPQAHGGCTSCGSSSVCFPQGGEPLMISANNELGARVGDIVTLVRPEGPRIAAAMLVFGLPVACTIGGVAAGLAAAGQDPQGAVAGALAGLVLGLFLLRSINKFFETRIRLSPRIDRIVSGSAA